MILDLIGLGCLAWLAAKDVIKAGAELGQKAKNKGQGHENPSLKLKVSKVFVHFQINQAV